MRIGEVTRGQQRQLPGMAVMLAFSRAVLCRPWPGAARGELGSGAWMEGARLVSRGWLSTLGALGFTRPAGPPCSPAGGGARSGSQAGGRRGDGPQSLGTVVSPGAARIALSCRGTLAPQRARRGRLGCGSGPRPYVVLPCTPEPTDQASPVLRQASQSPRRAREESTEWGHPQWDCPIATACLVQSRDPLNTC